MKSKVSRNLMSALLITSLISTLALAESYADSPKPSNTSNILVSGDVEITKQMYLDRVMLLSPKEQAIARYSPSKAREIVNELYRRQKLVSEAARRGVDKEPETLRRIEFVRDQEIINALQEKIRNELDYPDFDELAKERFLTSSEKFSRPEHRRARHILLRPERFDGGRAEAESLARTLIARMEQGESFAKLAEEYSHDGGSAKKGGELGSLPKGKTVEEFEAALWNLEKPGDRTDVIETKYGLHVIQLDEIEQSRPLTVDEALPQLRDNLAKEWARNALLVWYEKVTDPSGAKSNDQNIDAMLAEFAAESDRDKMPETAVK